MRLRDCVVFNLCLNMEQRFRTDYLFPASSFLSGMGSVLNVAGNYFRYNTSPTPEEADEKALASDWGVIGQDIREAIDKADTDPKKP